MLSTESNLRSIQPKAELPLVHVPLANAMPTRPPKGPTKNLTGIYLGSESRHAPQGVKHSVPPLARGRGMPSHRVRTPTEQRRYRKVELLRIKEEKRGFSGNPLRRKKHPQGVQDNDPEEKKVSAATNQNIDFWDITKQNPRNFTASTNTGVTHFEFLAPELSEEYYEDNFLPHREMLAQEIHNAALTKEDLSGIVDCYKKVCRGNFEALQHLMPQRKVLFADSPDRTRNRSTGFSVKSYRNPNQAEIVASFPPPDVRPKTVGTSYIQRAYVPAPYFFKSYQPPKTAGEKSLEKDFSPYGDIITAVPGAGVISRSVSRGRQNTSPRVHTPMSADLRHRQRENIPLAPTTTPTPSRPHLDFSYPGCAVKESRVEVALPKVFPAQSGAPTPSSRPKEDASDSLGVAITSNEALKNTKIKTEAGPDDTHQREENVAAFDIAQEQTVMYEEETVPQTGASRSEIAQPAVSDEARVNTPADAGDAPQDAKQPDQSAEIMIGLEDESGEQKPVEIDETDEALATEEVEESPEEIVAQQGRRVSITGRVLKSKNSEQQLQTITKSAEDRKRELAELLSEHAQLVHQVSSLEEVTSPSADKENATFETPSVVANDDAST